MQLLLAVAMSHRLKGNCTFLVAGTTLVWVAGMLPVKIASAE